MCLISYKSRLYFALVKSVLKLQSYEKLHMKKEITSERQNINI